METFDLNARCSKLADYYKRTAKVPVFGWSSDVTVKLHQIYTRLSWVKKEQTPTELSPSDLTHYGELFTADEDGVVPKRILVQGETGIGKSTFVKKLALDWAELGDWKTSDEKRAAVRDSEADALKKFQLVLTVTLKEVSRCQTLREVLACSLLIPSDKESLTDDLFRYVCNNQEKVLLVLDGYDEYRAGGEEFRRQFGGRSSSPVYQVFCGNYLRDCTVLITTRASRSHELQRPADKHAEITGFNEKDKLAFMKKVLNNEIEVNDLSVFLKERDIDGLARVPLLNLFFCLLWKQKEKTLMQIVKTETSLFKSIVRYVLRYSQTKQCSDQEFSVVKEENYDEILNEIGKTALECLQNGDHVFEYGQLSKTVRSEKSLTVGLLQLSQFCGASLERMDMVSFTHMSIQEFLAAWFVTNSCVSEGHLGGIEKHAQTLEDCESLRKVFQFICGLSDEGAVEVFRHLSTVRVSDPSLDTSKMIPGEENGMDAPTCEGDGITKRQARFNFLVFNCFQEVASKSQLINYWFDCTGGFIFLYGPLGLHLVPNPAGLMQALHCWGFVFPETRLFDGSSVIKKMFSSRQQVERLCESVDFLGLSYLPLRMVRSSAVFKLGDFLNTFLNECDDACGFTPLLCCCNGQIHCYIKTLELRCNSHVRIFTEYAATSSVQSPSSHFRSSHSCLEFLTSVDCFYGLEGGSVEAFGAMIQKCKHLQEIKVWENSDMIPELMKNLSHPGLCFMFVRLTSPKAKKLAALLPSLGKISFRSLELSCVCAEAVTTIITSMNYETLYKLLLTEVSFDPELFAALGRALPEMTSLQELRITGSRGSILQLKDMKTLFGEFYQTLSLDKLTFEGFLVKGGLASLTWSLRFFSNLTELRLDSLGIDEEGLCLLIESFKFIPNLEVLDLRGNSLGHAVTSIIPHMSALPELCVLNVGETGCSREDVDCLRKAAAKPHSKAFVFSEYEQYCIARTVNFSP